jgi:hypothetical protein
VLAPAEAAPSGAAPCIGQRMWAHFDSESVVLVTFA